MRARFAWLALAWIGLDPAGACSQAAAEDAQAAPVTAPQSADKEVAADVAGEQAAPAESPAPRYRTRQIEGWTVNISEALGDSEARQAKNQAGVEQALELLQAQLAEIVRVVPAGALAKLREVPLWFSPEYPGIRPSAEYHPDAGWLRSHGRNPAMARGVEFTNVRIFAAETRRMPNFALHELAHAYHDRVLGFDQADVVAAYERAKADKSYDKVERTLGNGTPNSHERAYALTNPMEFFAETSEAFFSRNDFYPFNRAELHAHDPRTEALLERLWTEGK